MQDIMLRFITILLIRLKLWKSLSHDCSAHKIRFKLDTHYQCSRPVNTRDEHGHSVYRALNQFTNVFSPTNLLGTIAYKAMYWYENVVTLHTLTFVSKEWITCAVYAHPNLFNFKEMRSQFGLVGLSLTDRMSRLQRNSLL